MAAENKPAGKGSHVSLLMHNLEESKNSEDGSDDEEEKQPGKLLAEKSRTVDDLLDEFNEAFRMKVSLFLKVLSDWWPCPSTIDAFNGIKVYISRLFHMTVARPKFQSKKFFSINVQIIE